MADVEETPLPGVGARFDFETRRGRRVGVLVHRSGRRELLVYDRADPDSCTSSVSLDADDALTLAELLGATNVGQALTAVQQDVEGLAIDWLTISATSPMVGETLRTAAVHTRTGASVVAIVRGATTIPAPGADATLEAGDTVVGVGTPEGMQQLAALLEEG
jgi:TrkA domain protein